MDSILILAFFSSGLPEKNRRVATFFKSVHFSSLIRYNPRAPLKNEHYFCNCKTTRGSNTRPMRNWSSSSSVRAKIDSKNVL